MRVISLRTKGSSNDPLGTRSDQVSPGSIPGLILLLVVLTAVLTFFSSTYRIFTLPDYGVGDIATSDILVPTDVPMQDEEATRIRQQEAQKAALPVYRHSDDRAEARIERICRLFSRLRSQLKSLNPSRSAGSARSLDQLPPQVQANLRSQLAQLLPEPELEPTARFLASNGFSQPLQQAARTSATQGQWFAGDREREGFDSREGADPHPFQHRFGRENHNPGGPGQDS